MISQFAAFFLATTVTFAQTDVLTRRVDNFRSGVNSHETILTQQAVRSQFGKLWTLYADAKIMAQPLICLKSRGSCGKYHQVDGESEMRHRLQRGLVRDHEGHNLRLYGRPEAHHG